MTDHTAPPPLPFAAQQSPDLERVRPQHARWLAQWDGAGPEAPGDRSERFDVPRLAALLWPHARGDDLALGCDVLAWAIWVDDWFDAHVRAADAASQVTQQLVRVVHEEERVAGVAPPLVRAFAELWSRCRAGMPGSWRARAALHWERYACANLHELRYRGALRFASLEEYLLVRRDASCLESFVDLIDRFGAGPLPLVVANLPQLRGLRQTATILSALTNDFFSLPKEEAAGDGNNVILVIERTAGCGRDEALERARRLVAAEIDRFQRLSTELPAWSAAHGLTREQTAAVRRHVDRQAFVMAGFDAWSAGNAKYAARETAPS